eukprot:TRINITY_DN21027_c0_g1_i1.p1 TRINITY_DN21027_c0_g1~~TRINITY_DN21027_c0_g1_i1.p1  ORF type:complete len:708 (+),score=311.65 TRINITY_DN21027_c0_g1_i1:97-2220(+)
MPMLMTPEMLPRRVLMLGQERAAMMQLAKALGSSEDVHMVATQPLAGDAPGTPAALDRMRNSYETASRSEKPYVGLCITPEQLRENRLPLHVLCESMQVSNLIVVNHSSVIDSLVTHKIGDDAWQQTTLCDNEVEDYLAKTLVDWDYVAQTLPVGVTFEGRPGNAPSAALLDGNCDVTFVEFDDYVSDPVSTVYGLCESLRCSTTGVSTEKEAAPSMQRRVSNMGELSSENLELSISVRNILLYRAESSEEDQSSVSILMSDDTDAAGSGSDASNAIHETASAPTPPSPDAYISTLRSVATGYDYTAVSSMMKRRHPMHYDSVASIGVSAGMITTGASLRDKKQQQLEVICDPEVEKKPAAPAAAGATQWKLLGFLACNVFFFHCLEAYLKEKIFHVEGFIYVEVLTVMQSLIVGSLALLECGAHKQKEPKEGAAQRTGFIGSILSNMSDTPLWVYVLLGSLIATSQYMTNKSILHLDYVTQVVFKSSKLLWVMAARVLFLRSKKRPSMIEWAGGVLIVAGLLTLSINTLDGKHGKKHGAKAGKPGASGDFSFSQVEGLMCITIALFCDASIFVVEEALAFGKYHASKQEVILFMQLMAIVPSSMFFFGKGNVSESISFVLSNPILLGLVIGCYACSYMGTRSILALVEGFDGTVAALVTSMRKIVTIILSFILFPKPITMNYVIGAVLIIVGANASIMKKFGNASK